MARPKKCRRICGLPAVNGFYPDALEAGAAPVEMTLDEYETVRLIDLLDCTQEDCAHQMKVARTTVQAVYDAARKKLAQALVEARPLIIRGGDYVLCEQAGNCCGKNCGRRLCENRCCENGAGGHCCPETTEGELHNENRGNL